MKILKFLLSISILFAYGVIFFLLFGPKNVEDYHTPNNQLLPEYDYIVIGAGSAGSVVSSRLAETGEKILLLEAGGSNEVPFITMPSGFPQIILLNPSLRYLDWGDSAKFEKGSVKRRIDFPRGKVVGGCGSINANIWNIGNKRIYDIWEEKGAKGWSWKDLEMYYNRAKQTLWIQEYPGRYIHKSIRDLYEVASKMYGSTESFNIKSKGFAFYETTMRNGRRWSSADAYLKPALRKYPQNLHLRLNSTVDRILFNEKADRAVGVLLENKKEFKARKEIILSAGAFNSPTILMRSGVGDSKKLQKFGIKTVKEIPGVGEHLQTHPTISFSLMTEEKMWDSLKEEPPKISKIIDYLIFGTGPYSSNFPELGGFIRTNHASLKNVEDIQYHCNPALIVVPELLDENRKKRPIETDINYITCIITLVTARDKGSVGLKSANPKDLVDININFLQYEEDEKSLVEAVSVLTKIFDDEVFKNKVSHIFPNKEELENPDKLKEYFYRSIFELYHPTGTCKMGDVHNDEKAVVDNELRLKGVKNLRVIDTSVFPEIPNSNTNAPVITIAEKGADLIKNKQ